MHPARSAIGSARVARRYGCVAVFAGVEAVGTVGVVAVGVLVVGGVVGGGAAVGSVATAGAVDGAVVLLSFVSATNAMARPAPARIATTARTTIGIRQFGVVARRVRAASPHSRHQSWSGPTGALQRGQRIVPLASGTTAGGSRVTIRWA
jgi:hypothetical protein